MSLDLIQIVSTFSFNHVSYIFCGLLLPDFLKYYIQQNTGVLWQNKSVGD